MELIQQLVNQLGVQQDQAEGGVGLLLKLANEKLEDGDFSQIADTIPGASDLMHQAPQMGEGVMGAVGGLASAFGGKAEGLGDLANLASGFSQLGLDSNMIGKFVPIIMSFVQERGGDQVKDLLEKVIGGAQ